MIKNCGTQHKKKALVLAITCSLYGSLVYAQGADSELQEDDEFLGFMLEEVVVFGVRASQDKAIGIKREAYNIVDSIVAEDIGKLPDLTITDSLQRIPGVQISREANEGTALNIRGMPQVLTTLNGEQFLSPWTITQVGANYSDIPAGMISGANVHKSAAADMLAGGISGTVDLKTFRPSELKKGFTGSVNVEFSQGSQSDTELNEDGSTSSRSPDTNLSLFVGYNEGDKWGFAIGAFKSDTYAANYQITEDKRLAFLDENGGVPGDPLDLDGDGDLNNDWYIVSNEYGARSNFMERSREGLSLTLEAQINDNFSVKGDVFYTRMDQYDRGVTASFKGKDSRLAFQEQGRHLLDGEIVYYGPDDVVPPEAIEAYAIQEDHDLFNILQSSGTVVGEGVDVNYVDADGNAQTRSLHTVQVAHILSPEFQVYSTNDKSSTAAINGNFQLDYTNQNNFKASLRYVKAEAEKQSRNSLLEQGTPAWLWRDDDGFGGKDRLDPFDATIDYRGSIPSFSFSEDMSSSDLLQYYQANASGDNTNANLDVLRADATYIFNYSDYFESLKFGVRYGVRDADYQQFEYVTPTARYSTWNDPNVAEDDRFQLREGNAIWQSLPSHLRYDYELADDELIDPDIGGLVYNGFTRDSAVSFTDFGPIKGFENGVAALNPSELDDPLAFMNRLYPGTRTVVDPSFNYSVEEASLSSFVQLDFNNESGIAGVPFRGNLGLRVVQIDREVVRSVVPEVLDSSNSIGSEGFQRIAFVTETETINDTFTTALPSLNVNFYPSESVVARFGMSRTISRNDLNNVGSGLSLTYQTCNKTAVDADGNTYVVYSTSPSGDQVAEKVSCVSGGSDAGNPNIKPWLADVYNTSLEWYFAEGSMLAAGLFLIKVDSSVEQRQELRSFKDADGVDRGRTANVWVSKDGEASDLAGLELGYKQAFNFLPGPVLNSTGVELNYTYSDSSSSDLDILGEAFPLTSNSEHQANLILWYDKKGLNVRMAYNWRSEEYLGRATLNSSEVSLNLGNWLEPAGYLDLSVNYWFNDKVGIFLNGSNLTETHRVAYSQFEDQFYSMWAQERRFTLGITGKL